MTIHVNDRPLETAAENLSAVAEELGLPPMTAVAVNGRVVPRAEWPSHAVCDGDRLVIIKVACGG